MSSKYVRKDSFYNKAKSEGQRCRAFYKIEEIDKKYKFFKPGMKVLDLGAWPGGWLQYAANKVGKGGLAVGIDLAEIQGFQADSNIKVYTGDIYDDELLEKMFSETSREFDVVMSDLSPKLTGIRENDMWAMEGLINRALEIAKHTLKPGGSFTAKVFMSAEAQRFVQSVKSLFNVCKREELSSSRKSSTEFYVVATGFNPKEQEQ